MCPGQRDPFSGDVADGALHGRGSADMKGALAAMVHGVAGLDCSRLTGRAVVSASVLEEVLEGVALAKVIEQTGADFVIIGEATELQLARAVVAGRRFTWRRLAAPPTGPCPIWAATLCWTCYGSSPWWGAD